MKESDDFNACLKIKTLHGFWDPLPRPLRPSQALHDLPSLQLEPKSLFLSLSMLQVVFLCLEHTKLIPVSRCLHLLDPLTGMPPLQSIMWLLLVQHLCLTSNITSLKRPSLTTYPSPHHFTNYCTFIFLLKTYQHLG